MQDFVDGVIHLSDTVSVHVQVYLNNAGIHMWHSADASKELVTFSSTKMVGFLQEHQRVGEALALATAEVESSDCQCL